MAGGNMGDLWFSLDIKSKIDAQLKQYSGMIKGFQKEVQDCQNAINIMSADLGKMAKGSEAWNKQKEAIASLFRLVDDLINKTKVYEEALGRVQKISTKFNNGGIIAPIRTNNRLDTSVIKQQIAQYEKAMETYREMVNVQKNLQAAVSMGARNKNQSVLGVDYALEKQKLEELKVTFDSLSNGHSYQQIKTEVESLNRTLSQFEQANKRAADSTRLQREEEQRRAKAMKDARIAFEPLVAAQARAEAQERANRANIEATNQARQRSVQVLRQQAEAMMQNHIAALQSQKTSLGRLYTQGKAMGLDPSELQTILSRYREIAQELLNMRTLMQNPGSMGYRDMFSMGRFAGAGANYVREATAQVSGLRQQTQEAAMAARNLATAFDKVHSAAQKSSTVLSDIKSLFLQGGLVFGAQQFARSIIQTGGDIVQQHIALRSILGDIQKADELFAQTQQLALQSPFTFQQLNKDVKQLAAFGVDTDRLYDTTKRLADVASGLGVSFERLGLAYGQVKARSWLDGKELRQFAYAGLPMLQKIADLYNETGKNGRSDYTTSDVRTMITKRQVSFEDVDKVFQRLTDKGGQFYNMQFVLSETLLGRWNKLEDAWTIMLGKFADGESVIGRVFSTAINGATNLVLSLDRLSPLLLSFGVMFAGRSLFSAIGSAMGIGTTGIVKQMALAQQQQMKQFATAQMQKVAEGEITTEIAQQNILKQRQLMTSAGVRDMTYAQIFAEGKISTLQLAQLARRGEVSASLITQLRTMGLITAKQEQLILQAKQEGAIRSRNAMMQLGGGTAMSKLGSFFTPGNIAMIGASIGMALWMGYSQWSNRIEQSAKAAAEHAKQQAKELRSAISAAEGSGATESAVQRMKEVVEQSDLYTGTMQKQVEQAGTLQEKYDALLQSMKQMQKVSEDMQRYSQNAEDAIKATSIGPAFDKGSWWKNLLFYSSIPPAFLGRGLEFLTNDDMEKNLEQYSSSRTMYDNSVDAMSEYAGQIHSILESIKGDYSRTYKAIQGQPFEEQLRILSQSGAWDEIIDRISESDHSFKGLAKTYIDNTEDVDDKWTELVTDDVPKLVKELAYQNNMSLEDYKEYCKKHPQYTAAMIREVVNSLNAGSKATKNQLIDVLLEFFGLARDEAKRIKGEAAKTEYQKQTSIGKKMMSAVIDKYGNGVVTTAQINTVAGTGDDWAKVQKNVQQRYSEASDNYAAAKGNKYVTASERASLLNERERWRKVAEANGMSVTSKSDKAEANGMSVTSKSDKADAKAEREREKAQKDAERAREKAEREFMRARQKEESSIQAYYDTWDKWRKVEGDTAARNRVANDPRFSKEFRNKYSDPEQLAKNYEKLAGSIKQTTDERKQFVQELKSKAAEKEAQIEYEDAQRLNNIFKEQLDNLSKRYDIYQRLANVAGRDVAGNIAFGRKGHSESYYAYLENRLRAIQNSNIRDFVDNGGIQGDLPGVTVTASARKVDFSKHGGLEGVLAMADEDVLSEYGTNVSNLIKALKAERDKLDASIVDTLEKGYEYFNNYGAQIDEINEKYDEQIERLKERNALDKEDKDYIDGKTLQHQSAVINQQRSREIASLNLKEFQNSDTWRKFFGTNLLLSTQQARSFADVIKGELTAAFEQGGISADEYTQKIEEVNKTLEDTENNRSDMFTYLFDGGIQGVLDKRVQKYQQQYNSASKDYDLWSKRYDEAEAAGNQDDMDFASKMKGQAKGVMEGADKMLQGAKGAASTVAIIDKIINGINDNVQKLKTLMDDIANSIEVFSGKEHADNFRNSKGYAFVSGFSSASQGATDAWNSLKSGNVMGVIEGGYRSFVGWAEPWARRHDAKLDKQIQLAERTNKLIDSMRSSIERRLTNSLGGVYGYKAKDSDLKTIKDGLDNYSLAKKGEKYGHNTVGQSAVMGAGAGAAVGLGTAVGLGALGGAISGLGAGVGAGVAFGSVAGPIGAAIGAVLGGVIGGLFGHKKPKYRTNYTEDTFRAMERADQTQEYYDQMFASYKMQRDNLDAQMKAEQKKKDKDKDKIQDYRSQLDELDDKIQTFAKDMAKSLYDIDVKSWANELTEAVVSAWAAGEDAVEAYKDKVKDLMRTLATNIIAQKIMEVALRPVEDYIEKIMDAQSGKLNEDNIVTIANMLDTIGDSTIPSIEDLLEKLKAKGWDLSDTNSSSMSSSIKGITENTGDLLAAYINAIRADVSVIRQLSSSILPELNVTVTAQLQQLNMIAANTRKNAEAAEQISQSTEEILYIFRAVTNDTKRISVLTR